MHLVDFCETIDGSVSMLLNGSVSMLLRKNQLTKASYKVFLGNIQKPNGLTHLYGISFSTVFTLACFSWC